MNKFVKNLSTSNEGIKANRATMLSQQASLAQKNLVNKLEGEYLNLKSTLEQLNDLAPDTTVSLKVGGDNFDAAGWVTNMQQTKIKLLNKKIELEVAQLTLTEWFTDESLMPFTTQEKSQ